jgi:cysteine synthase A
VPRDILECIGDTPLVPLRHVAAEGGARILLKVESENPTGSMKDRMALAMIEAAEGDGRLAPGGAVVEYTGGSTGVSLALVCAVKGHPLHVVSSDAFSREKLDHMKILGATLEIVPSESGRMTEKLTRDMIAAAGVVAARTGAFWTDQMKNTDQLAAYRKMAQEIWEQTGGAAGAHKIDGIGAGFVVPLWEAGMADRIEQVSMEEAVAMAFRLAREEGLFAGTSTGANVIAALRLAGEMGRGTTVVTVMCDTGMKYLRTYGSRL